MKNIKINKFITIGALAVLGSLTSLSAQADIPTTDEEILAVQTIVKNASTNMNTAIEHNLKTPFFTEKPNINMTLVLELEDINHENVQSIISTNKQSKGLASQSPTNKESLTYLIKHISEKLQDNGIIKDIDFRPPGGEFYRSNNECKINIFFRPMGSPIEFTPRKNVLNITKMDNQEQINMAQNFVLLHEQSHCEFGNIPHPVMIPNKSEKLNKELSYLLRDQVVDNFGDNIGYMSLLNENYADISAAYALIREHGADNNDLNYVLNAIKIQRQDNYFFRDKDTHFSHMGLSEALQPENIQKMLSISTNEEMNNFILKIANNGVLKVMADNPKLEKAVFDKDNFTMGFLQNTLHFLISDITRDNPEFAKSNGWINTFNRSLWGKDIQRGFSYEFSKELFEQQKFDKSDSRTYYQQVLDYTQNMFEQPLSFFQKRRLENAYKTVYEMQDYVQQLRQEINLDMNPEVNTYLSHQKRMNVEEAKKQMTILRSQAYIEKHNQKKVENSLS